MLSSLTEWSAEHIRGVFEAQTDDDSLRAIVDTFSDKLTATVNGRSLTREGVSQLVLAMRKQSRGCLAVKWKETVEVPRDPASNRDGAFGGVYYISGLEKQLPDVQQSSLFERRKVVTVQIESQNTDPNTDSRKIVNLVFVALDVKAD